jgi:phage-related protein
MTEGKTGRRPLFWEDSAKRDFKQFPEAVQKDMGVALFVVQLGGTPPSAKPWKGLGPGVYELVDGAVRIERSIWCGLLEGYMCSMRSRRNLNQESRRPEQMSNWSRRD